jgi:NitT/TauT family transport system permease protein
MFAAILLVMVVTLFAEYIMTLIENRLAKWRPQQHLDSQ